jgi:hypothetical protein
LRRSPETASSNGRTEASRNYHHYAIHTEMIHNIIALSMDI